MIGVKGKRGSFCTEMGGNRQHPLPSAPPARTSVLTAWFYQPQPPRRQDGFRAMNPRVCDLPLKTAFPQHVARTQVLISTLDQNGMIFSPKVTMSNLSVKNKYKYTFRLRAVRVGEPWPRAKPAGFLLASVQFSVSPKHLQ